MTSKRSLFQKSQVRPEVPMKRNVGSLRPGRAHSEGFTNVSSLPPITRLQMLVCCKSLEKC